MAEKVEILTVDASESTKTLGELKEEVKKLRKELDGCKVGSLEFTDTLDKLTKTQQEVKDATKSTNDALEGSYDALVQKMSELKKIWRATNDEVKRQDIGEQIASINDQLKDMDASIGNYQRNVGNYSSAFEGVTMKIEGFNNGARSIIGTFDLVEGGLKAIGVESEAVNGMMDKMQGLMIMTNGLNSVKEGIGVFTTLKTSLTVATGAQWSLNAAMSANPIGAVVAVVAALVAGLTALVGWMNTANDSAASLEEQNNALTESYEKQNDALDYNIRLMKAKGATDLEALRYEYKERKRIADEAYADYQKMYKEAKGTERWLGLANPISDDEQEQLDAAYQRYLDLHKEYTNAVKDYNVEVTRSNYQMEQDEIERSNRNRERWRADADRRIEEERRAIAEINKLYHEQAKERSEYWLNDLQLQLKRAEEWAEEEKAVVRKQYANKLITEEEYLNQIFEIDRIFADKKRKIYEEAELASIEYFEDGTTAFVESEQKKQVALDETANKVDKVTWKSMEMGEKLNAAAGLAGTAFGQTVQVLNTLANAQDKTSKEGFENYKKLSYGAAVMSMLQGIISSWTSAMSLPAPISFITGGLMTAATATLGALQIDSIKKQSFNGSSSSTSSSTASVPQINTAALLSSPVNYTTEVQGAQAIDDAMDTRVYVVESDITSAVNKVKVTEDESTF
jgi:uncharacterized protein YukE